MDFAMNESSIISQNNKKHMEHLSKNGGYFMRFEWMPEGFGQVSQLARQERINNKIKETSLHDAPFNANQNKRLMKYEYPFQDNIEEKFVYGFLC